MTLVKEATSTRSDPIEPTDLTNTGDNRLCICGKPVYDGHLTETETPHAHLTRDGIYICRLVFECNDARFYQYVAERAEKLAWINAGLRPNIAIDKCPYCGQEPIVDIVSALMWKPSRDHAVVSKRLEYGKTPVVRMECKDRGQFELVCAKGAIGASRQKEELRIPTKWKFVGNSAISEDYSSYLDKTLVVAQELELDWKRNVSDATLAKIFGRSVAEHGDTQACPVCGDNGCFSHLPDNLIRTIQNDGSIEGKEFHIYGSNISSEEYARRLPLKQLIEHFKPTQKDGLHVHMMLVHDARPLPIVILQNVWQLFRYYYTGYVYMFGNQPVAKGLLRDNEYSDFDGYKLTPTSSTWFADLIKLRSGMNVRKCRVDKDSGGAEGVTKFDIEFRTADSTQDIEQLVAHRATGKAMVLKAAQLAFAGGLINVESFGDWETVKTCTAKLNERVPIDPEEHDFMKQSALRLVKELTPFLDDYERACVMSIVTKPVRDRREAVIDVPTATYISEDGLNIKRVIAIANIEAENQSEWVQKASRLIGVSERRIETAISEIGAKWDKEVEAMVTR